MYVCAKKNSMNLLSQSWMKLILWQHYYYYKCCLPLLAEVSLFDFPLFALSQNYSMWFLMTQTFLMNFRICCSF